MGNKIGYRYNAVDIHGHILPGCDDGAKDIQETMELLRADREEGVLDIIATPHYGIENRYAPKAAKVRSAFDMVIPIRSHPAKRRQEKRVLCLQI